MVKIRTKTPAELENQVASYLVKGNTYLKGPAAHDLGDLTSRLLQLDRSPSTQAVASTLRDHATQPIDRSDWNYMLPPEPISDEHVQDFIAGYPQFLLEHYYTHRAYDREKLKQQMIARYDEFHDLVDQIVPQDDDESRSGAWATPYAIEKDGVEYIVRKIRSSRGAQEVAKHIEAGLRVQDIDHLEHIVAISYIDNVTIAPRLPGGAFKFLGHTDDAPHVTEQQLRDLVDAMIQASERGVSFDGLGGNFLYDREAGFNVIDLEVDGGTFQSWHNALYLQIRAIITRASKVADSLDYLHEIDRISGIIEQIFVENEAGEWTLDQLRRTRHDLTNAIDKLTR